MAIIGPLSRSESHIDAREYNSKVRQKFPPSIQRQLLEKEYEIVPWVPGPWVLFLKKFENQPKNTKQHKYVPIVRHCCIATRYPFHKCTRYQTVDSKRGRIRKLNKCFKCFSSAHVSTHVQSRSRFAMPLVEAEAVVTLEFFRVIRQTDLSEL